MPVSGLVLATKLISQTIAERCEFVRQVVGESLEPSSLKIGGEGIIVEIHETKLGKRKYNRDHSIKVFG
jgi:hypothetical protein